MTYRNSLLGLVVAAAILAGNAQAAVTGIIRISTTVSDLHRSVSFYEHGLGFRLERYEIRSGDDFSTLMAVPRAQAKVAILKLGEDELELVQYSKLGAPIPADSSSTDLWFQHFAIVVSNMSAAYAHLRKVPIQQISVGGPQQLPPNTGSVQAFKFKDPDGHPLELIYFPRGAGRPIWHLRRQKPLFMGIDHSAISISDTAASRQFYGDLLGMNVAYTSTNTGAVQEKLDGTSKVVLQITGMRAGPEGMGMEFLEYKSPGTGRPAPENEASNDLEHMHLLMRVDQLDPLLGLLNKAGMHFVSQHAVDSGPGERAIVIRDPDLHEVMLIGP